jgi:hypothetical protein
VPSGLPTHQTREYPTTGQAGAASGARLDAQEDRCLGGWVDDHGVSEAFELRDQTSGVGLVVAAGVPVDAQVVVGLIAFQHPVADTKMVRATATWARPIPRRFINQACWAAR